MAKKAKRVWVLKCDDKTDTDYGKYAQIDDDEYSDDINDATVFPLKRDAKVESKASLVEIVVRAEVYTEMRPVECLREVTKA